MLSVEIIKTLKDGSFIIKCSFCEGNGNFPETPFDENEIPSNSPCPVCRGQGLNVFRGDIEDYIDCKLCAGNGKSWDENGYFVGDICTVCQGKGVISLNKEPEYDFWHLIHPHIAKVTKSRFETQHYADSVEAALKEVNNRIKAIVKAKSLQELDGSSLMTFAFSLKKPVITLADLSTESGSNIQNGYMQIFSGVMTGIRNPKAHENLSISKEKAIHFLYLASLLMYKIDESTY